MQTSGNSGRSARHYGDELETLRGLLTTDEEAVYPDDECLQCLREGKVKADEKCFHRHWQNADQKDRRETR
jgi:hypothetical protein